MKDTLLDIILEKAKWQQFLSKAEIRHLLHLTDVKDIKKVRDVASALRTECFGNRVFLYGFLYFSTFCRNDCNFCNYRKSNTQLARYRKKEDEIVIAAQKMKESGVHLIDLTMGEDPMVLGSKTGLIALIELIRRVRQEVGLPVMVSPGVLPDNAIERVATAGADWYACYQETFSESLFKKLRTDQSFSKRLVAKLRARNTGSLLIEEGLLVGVGEELEDIVDALVKMREMCVDQARVMTFVPQKNTPMAVRGQKSERMELLVISIIRLLMPDILIPASLDIDGLAGVGKRLEAGANVITSIVPAQQGLAGVANNSLDIEESRRSVESVQTVLNNLRLESAKLSDYTDWLEGRKYNFDKRATEKVTVERRVK